MPHELLCYLVVAWTYFSLVSNSIYSSFPQNRIFLPVHTAHCAFRSPGKSEDLLANCWRDCILETLEGPYADHTSCCPTRRTYSNRNFWWRCKIHTGWCKSDSHAFEYRDSNHHAFLGYYVFLITRKFVCKINLRKILVLYYCFPFDSQWGLDLSRFPFFVLRYELTLGQETLDPVLRVIAWSLNVSVLEKKHTLYHPQMPRNSPKSSPDLECILPLWHFAGTCARLAMWVGGQQWDPMVNPGAGGKLDTSTTGSLWWSAVVTGNGMWNCGAFEDTTNPLLFAIDVLLQPELVHVSIMPCILYIA